MKISKLAGGAALLTIGLATAAHADITPEEAWADWQAMGTAWGQEITAESETREGDTLIVSGVRLLTQQPDTTVEGTIDSVSFRDKGDGTVEITSSEEYPFVITTTPPAVEGEPAPTPVVVNLTMTQSGMVMTASGEPGDTKYDYTIPMLGVTLGAIETAEGVQDNGDVTLAANNVTGSSEISGEARDMTSDMAADNLVATISVADDAGTGVFNMTAELAGLDAKSTATGMGYMVGGNMAAALREGFASLSEFSYESSNTTFDFTEAANTASGTATSGSGTLNLSMDEAGLGYSGSVTDVDVKMTSAQIPFPLALAYDEASFDFAMPVVAGPEPQEFKLATRTTGLTLSDDVWNLFDPSGVLPRDPATLVIDTSGTATVDVDFMDPANTEALAAQAPGEFNSLDVNELHLNLAGADMSGTGGFTFDNEDMTTFEGFPAPTGKLNLRLVGGNGLIDKAVQMGFVPEDQAMGARMMLGMFARMVEGEDDTMTSEIEFKDKQLHVNGQRLQ